MILITGGCGFIGSHTTIELLQNNYDCIIIDNFSNSSPSIIPQMEKISGKKINFQKIEMVDKNSLDAIFKKYRIDCVIHFAGLKAVSESQSIPLHYYRNNLISTLNFIVYSLSDFRDSTLHRWIHILYPLIFKFFPIGSWPLLLQINSFYHCATGNQGTSKG